MKLIVKLFLCAVVVCTFGCSSEKQDVNIVLTEAVKEAKLKQWKKTFNLATKALEIEQNNSNALLIKSIAADNLEMREVAIDLALQAVKIDPDNFVALYTIGNLYSQDDLRLSDAIGYLKKAHKINPEDMNTLILLANNSIKLKSGKAAKEYLDKLSQLDGTLATSPVFCNMLGCANIFETVSGSLKDGGAKIISAYKNSPNDPVLVYNIAVFFDSYCQKGKHALPYYDKVITLAGNNQQYAALKTNAEKRLKEIR